MSKIAVTVIASILLVCLTNAEDDKVPKTDSSDTKVVQHGGDDKTLDKAVLQTRLALKRTNEIPMTKSLCGLFNGIYIAGKCYVLIGKGPKVPLSRFGGKRD